MMTTLVHFGIIEDLTDPESPVVPFGTLTLRRERFVSWVPFGAPHFKGDTLISGIARRFGDILKAEISEDWPRTWERTPDLPLVDYLQNAHARSSFPVVSVEPASEEGTS